MRTGMGHSGQVAAGGTSIPSHRVWAPLFPTQCTIRQDSKLTRRLMQKPYFQFFNSFGFIVIILCSYFTGTGEVQSYIREIIEIITLGKFQKSPKNKTKTSSFLFKQCLKSMHRFFLLHIFCELFGDSYSKEAFIYQTEINLERGLYPLK